MIPADKVKKIIERYESLEKELSTGEFDSKLFAKKSKEYSDLKNIINPAKQYLNFESVQIQYAIHPSEAGPHVLRRTDSRRYSFRHGPWKGSQEDASSN